MADEVVVTELIIDARGAEAGSAAYVRAMKAAQSAVDKVIERDNAANAAIEKTGVIMTSSAGGITSAAKAWDRLKAAADPAVRSSQAMERALLTADAAGRKLGVSEAEIARVLAQVRLQHDAVAAAADAQAKSYSQLAAAGREALAAEQAQASINRTLGVGNSTTASARASASAFSTELDRLDEIARLKGEQAGAVFAQEFNQGLATNLSGKSARESASAFEAAARETEVFEAKVAALRAEMDPLAASQARYHKELDEFNVLGARAGFTSAELAKGQALVKARAEEAAAAIEHGAGAAGHMTTQTMSLVHAARSFAEQLALGVSPLQAITAQMNHLTYAASGPGGIGAIFSTVGSFALRAAGMFARFIPEITAVVGGFFSIKDAAEQAEHRSVGFGETFHAIFQTIGNDIRSNFGTAIDTAISPLTYAFQKLGSAAVDIAELVINSFHAAAVDIIDGWKSFPAQMGLIFGEAANMAIVPINYLVKKASDGVDAIIAAFNKIPGIDIAPINAPEQLLKGFDTTKLKEQLTKALEDRNAEVDRIMASHPLRTFASDVVDQIKTNHDLESLGDLSKINFGGATSSANGLGSAVGGIGKAANGVTVELGGMSQQVINVSRVFQDAKLAQMGELQQATINLHSTQAEIKKIQDDLKAAPHAAIDDVFGKGFAGNTNAARDAIDRTVTAVDKLYAAYDHGNGTLKTLHESEELLRQSLLAQGGDPVAINAFFDSIISGEIRVRQLRSTVQGLHEDISSLPNKTVTITVRTQQVGTGTKSIYDVGTTGGIGVTRYGAAPGEQSGPSVSSYSVPSSYSGAEGAGTGSSYGGSGSSTVNVTRFATGGVIHPGDSQRVQFFKSPEETVGIFTPKQMSALADPQSAYTGQVATREDDRLWQVFMNIDANTRKTYEGVEKWGASAASSSYSGGGSSGGSSSSGGAATDPKYAAYLEALRTAKSNAVNVSGIIGYGSQGLSATPEQIAHRAVYGFSTGGVMGPGNGDTQKVEFFKKPSERAIIVDDDQFEDERGGKSRSAAPTTIPFSQTNHWYGNAPPSKESLAASRRATELGMRDALRSVNGR